MVRNRIPRYLGDWPWGREDEVFTTPELDSGVGGIPTVRGEGLMHRPHGSDWSSIREAGLKAAKPGACPRDAASRDRVGYAEKGIITVVRLIQRKRLRRWSQKAQDRGPACFHVTGSHPQETRQSRPLLPLAPNRSQERRNPAVALQDRSWSWRRCQPQGLQERIESEAKACLQWAGYADRLTGGWRVKRPSRVDMS